MRMLLYISAFVLIGSVAGLIFRRYRPAAAPPSVWISTLLGVTGSLIAGLLTLTMLSYGGHVYEIGYDHIYSDSGGLTLPAYWLSLVIAPLGALLVLTLNRLRRASKRT